jgi:citrate lyase subunit beta/citryl-CoA lyase
MIAARDLPYDSPDFSTIATKGAPALPLHRRRTRAIRPKIQLSAEKTMTVRPRRSVLYMPGSNARALEKAKTIAADALILDLEDAVAPDAKAQALAQVADAVKAGGYGPRELVIRINGLDTPWGAEDLRAAVAAGPDAILLPKPASSGDIDRASAAMRQAGAGEAMKLWAMIETPIAILKAGEIASAARHAGSRLSVLVMGTNDLIKETGATLDAERTSALYWLSAALTAARAYGLEILDGVYNNFRDMDGYARECRQGRTLGFDGKTLIHPDQVMLANEVFSPPAAEVEFARKIIAAFDMPEHKGKGVINLEGRMVELLHADIARRTVAIADAIAERG